MGPAASPAVSRLVAMLNEPPVEAHAGVHYQTYAEGARSQVLTALARIGDGAREATPTIVAIANDSSQSEGLRRHALRTLRAIAGDEQSRNNFWSDRAGNTR
jgi:hypothetical protein